MKLSKVLGALAVATLFKGALVAGIFSNYNYISPEETAELVRNNPSKVVIVDIQEKPGFEKEHLKGAKATYAYPVKTEDEKGRLEALYQHLNLIRKLLLFAQEAVEERIVRMIFTSLKV